MIHAVEVQNELDIVDTRHPSSDLHLSNVKACTSIEETEEYPLQLSLITGTKIDNESYRA
jgi:hypothetical protein